MRVDISPSQRDLLLHLVDVATREIGPEIRHTDSARYRDELREQRAELRELHTLLCKATPDAADRPEGHPGLVGTP